MNDIAIDKEHLHYLEQLSEMYPTIGKASSEIINLQAILNLPKGTEHFVSDVHGEYEAFSHVLKNGSGAVRKKIDDVFGLAMNKADKAALATLIYYPREKMELVKQDEPDMDSWYKTTLYKLIEVCKTVSSKYTRSKVRKALPEEYAYVIEELITEKPEVLNKEAYYESIINTTVELGTAEEFIVVLSELIQRLAVDHLHVLGDIYDRGAGPHLIMDRLCRYHSLDIQWGNHDIIWMGAAAGNPACIATVVRNSIRYGNLDVVEEGYGINMLPLATFALKAYKDDPCTRFVFKVAPSGADNMESDLIKKMHKAIAIIRFKLEGQLIKKWPEYGMKERLLLEHIDYEQGTIELEGRTYKLLDTSFPTIDPADPYRLTEGEEEVIQRLRSSFIHCEKLKNHVGLLLKKGSMYKVYNGNLLFHGCIPMEEDGSFAKVNIYGKEYSGKALFDILETYVRKAFFSDDKLEKQIELQKRTNADLLFTGSAFMDSDGQPIDWYLHAPAEVTYRQLLKQNVLSNSSALVRKELYAKHYAIGDGMHEDFAIWLSILKEGKKAYGVDEPLLIYRIAKSSKSGNKVKAAKMNWNTYRYIGLNPLAALYYECWYMVKGLLKYKNLK